MNIKFNLPVINKAKIKAEHKFLILHIKHIVLKK